MVALPVRHSARTCPLVDFVHSLEVTVETDLVIDELGVCDEHSCSTDESLDQNTEVGVVSASQKPDGTWSLNLRYWMPDTVGFVAVVAGEEIDLGEHDIVWDSEPVAGEHCGSIPVSRPLTIQY